MLLPTSHHLPPPPQFHPSVRNRYYWTPPNGSGSRVASPGELSQLGVQTPVFVNVQLDGAGGLKAGPTVNDHRSLALVCACVTSPLPPPFDRRFVAGPSASAETGPGEALKVSIANAAFGYGFEYLGVGERLVQTPLTDRCFLTLAQALSLRLGGNPFGPAGTGKTESVKALGCQLGRFVLVFNCDEHFDFKAMGRIFVGLCQVGAWGCFDEFNRLEERILSAVSAQILAIQTGLLRKVSPPCGCLHPPPHHFPANLCWPLLLCCFSLGCTAARVCAQSRPQRSSSLASPCG
jgi:hypothetical protein